MFHINDKEKVVPASAIPECSSMEETEKFVHQAIQQNAEKEALANCANESIVEAQKQLADLINDYKDSNERNKRNGRRQFGVSVITLIVAVAALVVAIIK